MTRVLATGVFNIIHPGHILFLEEARKLGDELIVIVSSDRMAKSIKKGFILPQEQRAAVVAALKPVDKVFVGDDEDTMRLLPKIKPDVIALGHDQKADEGELRDKLEGIGVKAKVVRITKAAKEEFASSSGILKEIK